MNLRNFLDKGYDVNKLHFVGHSLGGHCIGLVARRLRKSSNYIIPRLYALDPAGPGFESENPLTKVLNWITFRNTKFGMISRDDADYVQIIHTNAGKYGISRSRGHADFYPNAGSKQAGCDLDFTDDVCSHRRAWIYYQESVLGRKPFLAVRCDSYEDFKQGNCKRNTITEMGYSNTHDEGNFYLITHSNPLLTSLGEDGIEYKNVFVITEDGTSEKPWLMLDSPKLTPSWEKDIEFEKLLVVNENGVVEKNFVPLSSPLELMGDDFEYVNDDTSGCAKLLPRIFVIFIFTLYF